MAKLCNGVGKRWVMLGGKYYCPSCQRQAEYIGAARPYGAVVQLHNAKVKVNPNKG